MEVQDVQRVEKFPGGKGAYGHTCGTLRDASARFALRYAEPKRYRLALITTSPDNLAWKLVSNRRGKLTVLIFDVQHCPYCAVKLDWELGDVLGEQTNILYASEQTDILIAT